MALDTETLTLLLDAVRRFVHERLIPAEDELAASGEVPPDIVAEMRELGLFGLSISPDYGGLGLNMEEEVRVVFELGQTSPAFRSLAGTNIGIGSQAIVLAGTDEQRNRYLPRLASGELVGSFALTEPDAGSDAMALRLSAVRDGDEYVLNGEKWWSSGAGDPRCAIYIVMVRTSHDGPKHAQHSMILVPADAAGVEKVRAMTIYGDDDAPHGHLHMRFTNVRVPASNLLLGEGKGFEIAQGRLGPGRIHHCMRAIGQSEMALELMCKRSMRREAFGQPLAKLGANYDIIAEARMEIEMARLLCLKAAWMMDKGDPKAAAPWISQIKVVAPRVALKIADEAVQLHGAAGVSQDTPLARTWKNLRTLRIVDGPDAVHRRQIARQELKKYTQEKV